MLEGVIQSLHRGRSCLALPKRKTLEELVKNPQLVRCCFRSLLCCFPSQEVLQVQKIVSLYFSNFQKALKPSLPNDTVLSFYVQAQKIILAIYQLYVNPQQKLDIGARYQVPPHLFVFHRTRLRQDLKLGRVRLFLLFCRRNAQYLG